MKVELTVGTNWVHKNFPLTQWWAQASLSSLFQIMGGQIRLSKWRDWWLSKWNTNCEGQKSLPGDQPADWRRSFLNVAPGDCTWNNIPMFLMFEALTSYIQMDSSWCEWVYSRCGRSNCLCIEIQEPRHKMWLNSLLMHGEFCYIGAIPLKWC